MNNDILDHPITQKRRKPNNLILAIPLICMVLIYLNALYTVLFTFVDINGRTFYYQLTPDMILGGAGLGLCLITFFLNANAYKVLMTIVILLWWAAIIRIKLATFSMFYINIVPAFFLAIHISINAGSIESYLKRFKKPTDNSETNNLHNRFLTKFNARSDEELKAISRDTKRTDEARQAAKDILQNRALNA